MSTFDECWKAYPHYKQRSKKAVCKAMVEQITTVGRVSRVDGLDLTLMATYDELLDACKAYSISIRLDDDENARQYVPGFQVWLNQGRFMDFDDPAELVEKYDRLEARIMQNKLRVVS